MMWLEKNDNLYKKFEFKDFNEAFKFVTKVAELAEQHSHHPKIQIDYSRVEIWLTTHDKNAITDKDKKLSMNIDGLLIAKDKAGKNKNIVKAKLFTDGGSRGNPGPSALGFVIFGMDDNVVKKGSKYLGVITNNQAEYLGLEAGLKECLKLGIKTLAVYMDSLLVVNQVKGIYKIKNPDLALINQRIADLAKKFDDIKFSQVPRELNKIADGLVNQCLDDNSK